MIICQSHYHLRGYRTKQLEQAGRLFGLIGDVSFPYTKAGENNKKQVRFTAVTLEEVIELLVLSEDIALPLALMTLKGAADAFGWNEPAGRYR